MELRDVDGSVLQVDADIGDWRTISTAVSKRVDQLEDYGVSVPLAERYESVQEAVSKGCSNNLISLYYSDLILAKESMRAFTRHAEACGNEAIHAERLEILEAIEDIETAFIDQKSK